MATFAKCVIAAASQKDRMMQQRWHILFSGRVQGVGFRYTCLRCARLVAVSGWVRNLPDGDVEMIVEGCDAVLKTYVREIIETTHGTVADHRIDIQPATGEFRGMQVTA